MLKKRDKIQSKCLIKIFSILDWSTSTNLSCVNKHHQNLMAYSIKVYFLLMLREHPLWMACRSILSSFQAKGSPYLHALCCSYGRAEKQRLNREMVLKVSAQIQLISFTHIPLVKQVSWISLVSRAESIFSHREEHLIGELCRDGPSRQDYPITVNKKIQK